MLKPKSTLYRLPRPDGPLTNDTLLMGANGNETTAIPLSQIKEFVGGSGGGGSPGQGFIFEDLADYVTTTEAHSKMEVFHVGAAPTLVGNNVVGALTMGSPESFFLAYFQVIKQTSYKMRLFPNTHLQIIATARKINFANLANGDQAIIEAGGKGPVNLEIGEGYINTNVENQDVYLEFEQQAEDWLEIVQTGVELIWKINGTEVVRTPQDPDDAWFNIAVEPSGDPEAPLSTFQYDLTNTLAGYEVSLDVEALTNMVIYQSSHDLKILDRYVAVGDYVQLYDNKSKVVIYPQLSRIYDFDLSDSVNRIEEPVTISTPNPLYTVTPSEEALKGSIHIPGWEMISADFEGTSTPETLEIFEVTESSGYGRRLEIKYDYDPEGLMTEVMAEFKLRKDYIHNFDSSGSSFGSASDIEYRVYAGADRDKNYLSLKITRYPTVTYALSIVDENGVENPWASLSALSDVRINLKEFMSLRILNSNSTLLAAAVVDMEDNYTKVLDFTNADTDVTVQVFYSVNETAAAELPWNYYLPFQNLRISAQSMRDYLNLIPIEMNYGSGNSTFKFDKQKSFGAYFICADSMEEICAKIIQSNTDLVAVMIFVTYNAEEDKYSYIINGSGSNNSGNGNFTLAPEQDFIINIMKAPATISMVINTVEGGLGRSGTGGIKQKLFLAELGPVLMGLGSAPDKNIQYDLSLVKGPSTINFDSIQTRDRVRFTGGTTTIAGQTINAGDIVEFFNGKEEVLVTRKQGTTSDKVILLEVQNNYGNIVDEVRAWYDPVTKRILFSGSFYYSGYGNNDIYRIILPNSIKDKINQVMSVGFFGQSSMTQYGSTIYASQYSDYLSVQMGYVGGGYVTGTVAVPDSTIATVS